MSKRRSHVHKYQRVKWGKAGTIIWRCMLPGCTHYVHTEMAKNRKSLCWKCLGVFVLTGEKLMRVRPKCDACQHTAVNEKEKPLTIDDLLENL